VKSRVRSRRICGSAVEGASFTVLLRGVLVVIAAEMAGKHLRCLSLPSRRSNLFGVLLTSIVVILLLTPRLLPTD
jgi:hypothetical protein